MILFFRLVRSVARRAPAPIGVLALALASCVLPGISAAGPGPAEADAAYAIADEGPARRVVETRLTIAERDVEIAGRTSPALVVNGGIPAPTLRWRVGDLARVHVTNEMDVPTSVHWHGLILPNVQDGVPGLTTLGIRPGQTYTFEIPISHAGTYWYHSHTGLQEQRGVYGAIVIEPAPGDHETRHPGSPGPTYDAAHGPMHGSSHGAMPAAPRDVVVVLSDWTHRDPDEVLRLLKSGNEWFSLEKGTAQSLWGALRAGELGAVVRRSLSRMPPMDISDVSYAAFLANGEPVHAIEARPGERLRLRVVNAAASTYFYLGLGGGPLRVLAADGVDVEPFATPRLLMAIAETYDFLVEVPEDGRIELRATAQDGSGHASAWIGAAPGPDRPAADVPRPNLYAMRHGDHGAHEMHADPSAHADHDPAEDAHAHGGHDPVDDADAHAGDDAAEGAHAHADHDMRGVPETDAAAHAPHAVAPSAAPPDPRPMPPYDRLRARTPSTLPEDAPVRTIRLQLTGNMERYVWSFDGRTLAESDVIPVRRGEVLRIEFENTTMMHHPLHLHGHFFRVLGAGARRADDAHAPLKHTVDVAPMATTAIEFLADAEGDWFFHCHILYHMKAGMSRVFHYEDWTPDPALAEEREKLSRDPWYAWARASILSQFTEGIVTTSNSRHELAVDWEIGWMNLDDDEDVDAEGALRYRYHFNRLYRAFGGFYAEEGREVGIFGGEAILPLNFEAAAWIDTEGHSRFFLEKELALTSRLALVGHGEYDTQNEWEGRAGLRFRVSRFGSLAFEWHSEFGFGAGLELFY